MIKAICPNVYLDDSLLTTIPNFRVSHMGSYSIETARSIIKLLNKDEYLQSLGINKLRNMRHDGYVEKIMIVPIPVLVETIQPTILDKQPSFEEQLKEQKQQIKQKTLLL